MLGVLQTMERARSQDTGIFKRKPADLMQIFRVTHNIELKATESILLMHNLSDNLRSCYGCYRMFNLK